MSPLVLKESVGTKKSSIEFLQQGEGHWEQYGGNLPRYESTKDHSTNSRGATRELTKPWLKLQMRNFRTSKTHSRHKKLNGIKVEAPGYRLIVSMEAELPTHYNEGISGSSHSNLDPMKVIMQELQLMRKDMKEMRGNITNLSIEHRDESGIVGRVTSHTQRGYGNFSSHARCYKRNSYDCFEGNILGTINGLISTNQDLEFNEASIEDKFGVGNHEGQRQGQAKEKFMKSSMGEKSIKVNELSQDQDIFEAQDMENEGSLDYKLYKTIMFLPSTSSLSFDFRINESNSSSFSFFCDIAQSQFFDFLTTICRTKPNHGMKAKGGGMGKKLSIGYEHASISLSLNCFLLCHELSFKELKPVAKGPIFFLPSVPRRCSVPSPSWYCFLHRQNRLRGGRSSLSIFTRLGPTIEQKKEDILFVPHTCLGRFSNKINPGIKLLLFAVKTCQFQKLKPTMKAVLIQNKIAPAICRPAEYPESWTGETLAEKLSDAHCCLTLHLTNNVLREIDEKDNAFQIWTKL
ncbi:hypothetical protein M9H77_30184 [Catharanthus roseus]|uniref:Uncharacterized protein n=1 Tax=Catharanthus roseus TaxID=4058 RepID=A0ACB9ZZ50_CATRO|nr:hypothetical protein M9H77_30184 [Catharanthus roseus]